MSTQLSALVLVNFSTAGLLQQLQPGGHQARLLGLLGQHLSPQALRFGEMGILGKFSIFNPANYVDMDIKTFETYGIAEFTETLKYCCGSQLSHNSEEVIGF